MVSVTYMDQAYKGWLMVDLAGIAAQIGGCVLLTTGVELWCASEVTRYVHSPDCPDDDYDAKNDFKVRSADRDGCCDDDCNIVDGIVDT